MTALSPQDRETVRRAALFARVSDTMLERLLKPARVTRYPRGHVLFLRDDPAERFFLLLEGWVKIFLDTPSGEQTVIEIFRPGETIAEAAIFLGRSYPASAEVSDDARILEIPADAFLDVLRADSDLALTLLASLSVRLHQLINNLTHVQAYSTSRRLADFLTGLSRVKTGPASVRLPYDKSLVAARLGMKPESLSRALARLREHGVTARGQTVEIADMARLRTFAEGEEND